MNRNTISDAQWRRLQNAAAKGTKAPPSDADRRRFVAWTRQRNKANQS